MLKTFWKNSVALPVKWGNAAVSPLRVSWFEGGGAWMTMNQHLCMLCYTKKLANKISSVANITGLCFMPFGCVYTLVGVYDSILLWWPEPVARGAQRLDIDHARKAVSLQEMATSSSENSVEVWGWISKDSRKAYHSSHETKVSRAQHPEVQVRERRKKQKCSA